MWKLGWHKHKHKHKKNGQVPSSCVCAYAYVVALTSEIGVDISTSISTRPWTNHRSLWPRPHVNISNKQFGGWFVHHLVHHWVEESWYQELSQICHSACAYALMRQWNPGLRPDLHCWGKVCNICPRDIWPLLCSHLGWLYTEFTVCTKWMILPCTCTPLHVENCSLLLFFLLHLE